MAPSPLINVTAIDTKKPPLHDPTAHHVGSPPTSFQNPWPSFKSLSTFEIFQTRFGSERNFVPVPPREELVQIHKPDWGVGKAGLKATWIGHASFLVETAKQSETASRGLRVLLDPLFSDRTSPVSWFGPKRYSPTPCLLEELPVVDAVVISHNHYDHLDLDVIRKLYARSKSVIHFFCALGNKAWFESAAGIDPDHVTELDWWDGVMLSIAGVGSVNLICTPTQHISGRTPRDGNKMLWCSWVLQDLSQQHVDRAQAGGHSMYFAGDTGYRHIPKDTPPEDESSLPACPAFADIGHIYGPFDLALLPIGLYSPRYLVSSVHCAPEETVCLHRDIRSKKSIGMHYGTVRGGLSAQYEDVREPPRRWKEACQKDGLVWGQEVGLCDIGETVVVR